MALTIQKRHLVLLAVNILSLAAFGIIFLARQNYEFVIYVAVIIVFLGLIAGTFRRVPYSDASLFGLTVWAILHMAGGAVYINQTRLYEIILVDLSAKYPIFRYDQLVHIWGFGAATLTMFSMLQPLLIKELNRFAALSIVVVMAGLGAGALNEIVEALVSAVVAESGVGGYVNTALDLIANLIGAILAMLYIRLRYFTCGSRR